MIVKPKHCPVCGGDWEIENPVNENWYVNCSGVCELYGPVSKTRLEAIERWNALEYNKSEPSDRPKMWRHLSDNALTLAKSYQDGPLRLRLATQIAGQLGRQQQVGHPQIDDVQKRYIAKNAFQIADALLEEFCG